MPNFICPRCGYVASQRCNIKHHFARKFCLILHRCDIKHHFARKFSCEAKNDVVLSLEIKEAVLRDHVYHPPPPKKEDGNHITIINQQQNIMNVIGQLDIYEKLNKLLKHKDKTLCDLIDCVDGKVNDAIKALDSGARNYYKIDQSDILQLIDEVTRVKLEEPDTMNILYDKKLNSVMMFMDAKWHAFWIDVGVIKVMEVIKDQYLDKYELYLIKKIYDYSVRSRNQEKCYEEYLEEYYRFIANFDLVPYICQIGESDKQVIGWQVKETNPHYVEDHYNQEYEKLKKSIKPSQRNHVRNHIVNIIKRNTLLNTSQLNQEIFDIIKVDEEFKKQIFGET